MVIWLDGVDTTERTLALYGPHKIEAEVVVGLLVLVTYWLATRHGHVRVSSIAPRMVETDVFNLEITLPIF